MLLYRFKELKIKTLYIKDKIFLFLFIFLRLALMVLPTNWGRLPDGVEFKMIFQMNEGRKAAWQMASRWLLLACGVCVKHVWRLE